MASDSADIRKQFASLKFGQPSLLRLQGRRHPAAGWASRTANTSSRLSPAALWRSQIAAPRPWETMNTVAGTQQQSDYDKLRRIPIYAFNILNMAALVRRR